MHDGLPDKAFVAELSPKLFVSRSLDVEDDKDTGDIEEQAVPQYLERSCCRPC